MIIVSMLLLLVPGILVWKLSGDQALDSKGAFARTLLTILVDDLLIYTAAFFLLNLVYGRIVVSFASEFDPTIGASLFHVSFAWKYGIMSCALAAAWAVVKVLFAKITRKRGRK